MKVIRIGKIVFLAARIDCWLSTRHASQF